MFKHFFVLVVLGTFICFLYGAFNLFLEVEDNACRMTYMFGYPQFSRVEFSENKLYPQYGLYYYYEGNLSKNVNKLQLNGAPVLFVPGNSGSYKQGRSLASVALQKALDSDRKIHLDYFTIDYNEELSAMHGGYLINQRAFLKLCIKQVLQLYRVGQRKARKVVIIGHSMGGKLAQSVLTDDNISQLINTIIFISTPIDRPVFDFDAHMHAFYTKTNDFFKTALKPLVTNHADVDIALKQQLNKTHIISNVLLISIGGGNRDLLVRAALTTSRYSDIHAMTSSIPNVWLSCDHLSVVWCLQLMLVINRFLFSIAVKPANENYALFNDNKNARLQIAQRYFVQAKHQGKQRDFRKEILDVNSWHVDSRRVFSKQFAKGLKEPYHELLPLLKFKNYENMQDIGKEKLFIEIFNEDNNDWIYGCEVPQAKFCDYGTSLTHFIEQMPAPNAKTRAIALLDVHNIRKTYIDWTHIMLRLPTTDDAVRFNVDFFNPAERIIKIKAPRWYDIHGKMLLNESLQNTVYYELHIQDLVEPYVSFSVNIEARACKNPTYLVTTKLRTPWANGFNRFNHISHETSNKKIFVNVPIAVPYGYNTSENPVVLEIFLDPNCRFRLSYKFEIAATMSRLVLEFYTWLPAHLTTVLLIVLKNQVLKLHAPMSTLRSVKPYLDFFQYTSLYVLTGCRLFKVLMRHDEPMETRETMYTFYAALVVHCAAIVICILIAMAVWLALMLQGNFFLKVIMRFTRTTISTSSAFMTIVSNLPIAFGILAISIAISTCSGIAIVIACAAYFILISDAYKDYLEDLMLKLAAKLFKKVIQPAREETVESINEITPIAENVNDQSINETDSVNTEDEERCEGLQNFAFHMTLLLLLCMHGVLNTTGIIAWVKNYKNVNRLPDPSLVPSVIIMIVLSTLWQLKAPRYFSSSSQGNMVVAVILYCCASICIIFCQDASYRLSYVITFVYVIILANELLHRLWQFCTPRMTSTA